MCSIRGVIFQTSSQNTVCCVYNHIHESNSLMSIAPILYLHSEETHFPADLLTFLTHTTPRINYAVAPSVPNPLTLSNLAMLSSNTYLTSNDDVTTDPEWVRGTAPNNDATVPGINSAVVINPKNDSSIDVFYFFFYAFNPGTSVLSLPFLNFGTSFHLFSPHSPLPKPKSPSLSILRLTSYVHRQPCWRLGTHNDAFSQSCISTRSDLVLATR